MMPIAMESAKPSRLGITTLVIALLCVNGCRQVAQIAPQSEDQIEFRVQDSGQSYVLTKDGNAYLESNEGQTWEHIAQVYDPEEVKRAYVERDGQILRVSPDNGKEYLIRRQFTDSFDDVQPEIVGLKSLISEDRRLWGSFTLQSPQAASVSDYVNLRKQILEGQSQFRDCSLVATKERSHTGPIAIKCNAPAKTSAMITCKASLSSPLVYFRSGDDFWFEAYYWIVDRYPLTLVDLECEFVHEHPGVRIRVYDGGVLGAELKALTKPQFRQSPTSQVRLPKKAWVQVRVHYRLSASEGLIEIYQDGQKVLESNGPTLPFPSAIYNSLEIGISAHSDENGPCTLYVDDVRVSDRPFE